MVFFFLIAVFLTSIFPQMEKKKQAFEKSLLGAGVLDSVAKTITKDTRFGIDSLILKILKSRKKPDYNFLFTEESIARGKSFLHSYTPVKEAAKRFNIPAHIIVAVFRIESDFGLFLGNHNAANTYFTLFSVSKSNARKQYLIREFKKILEWCGERRINVFSVPTSWAGAVGLPQFMPSSFSLAVDGDNDGSTDILSNFTDAVWSIANYLRATNWNPKNQIGSLMRYNNSILYAKNVLKYAQKILKK